MIQPTVTVALLWLMTMNTALSAHTFRIGEKDFLLDDKPLQIRCGEIHFARVPREYWSHRLKLCKAMGLNAVCAYLFWNYHEFEPGQYDWSGQADAAEFCRLAQREGLWVILRPGPYACAEWDGGGLPWWLLKNPNIQLRSQDPAFLGPATAWLKEVGRVLGPLQVTRGGPILMVQVENEYGSYGNDAEYMGKLRQALLEAGFDVPLFACNPPGDLKRGWRSDLFQVVNFGSHPEAGFKALRAIQPSGPLMCGEFYPGWFDTWGAPHHLGKTQQYLADLEHMLKEGASFSIYMAHGGTTFGMWSGADRPFKPDTSSYDYDAPISEAGWVTEKFRLTRELMANYAGPLPEPPPANPVMSVPAFRLEQVAPIFDNLPAPVEDDAPRPMEAYDQGHGCILYRATMPAGPATTLKVDQAHDFAWVFLDGQPVGIMDRRTRRFQVPLPAREKPARLDILVEAMGHVNFGKEIHDRKGLQGNPVPGAKWQVYRLDESAQRGLKWKRGAAQGPAYWRGTFTVEKPADTFLDLRNWGKGVVWINGRCLARFWNIGPTQTAYLPAPWLRVGENEVVILDLLGPTKPEVAGLEKPILDQLRPELDFAGQTGPKGKLTLGPPVFTGAFAPGAAAQEVKFPEPIEGRQFCIESRSAHDGKPFAAIAELDLLDPAGQSIPHTGWTIAYVDSEELVGEDGSAGNAINGQVADFWHTEWKNARPAHPHQLVIDLGGPARIGGFRYVPRAGENVTCRIREYRIYIGAALVAAPEASAAAPAVPSAVAIRPGEIWLDDRGQHIQAHGGGILKHGDSYYWFGEYRAQDLARGRRAVACYASKDLIHWQFRSKVIDSEAPFGVGRRWVLERPKVYYNEKTKKFVMYMHLDGTAIPNDTNRTASAYALARVAVATCDTVDGNYTWVRSFRPLGKESRDIGQFVDDDGSAYLIFESRPTKGFYIAKLSDDYLDVEKEVCFIRAPLEGGALVRYDGLYYLIGSYLTGWAPNPNQYATAARLEGPWSEFRDIAPPETKTYGSQSTMMLKVVGTKQTTVIFMGDIWKPREQWDSRYLWMPLEIGGGRLRLPAPRPWTIDVKTGETRFVE